ncbi:MAG: type II secretion system protein GspG, partial [Planctomycetota bacterium]
VGFATESSGPEATVYEEEWDLIEPLDPASATDQTLLSIRVGLEAYRYDRGGAYPNELGDLLETNDQFPKGYVTEGLDLLDGWGRSFVYQPSDDGSTYSLRSLGPNGQDDGGTGDDIVLQ